MTSAARKCAFKACNCSIDSPDAVQRDGKVYCSERCVDHRGCDHAGCNCGKFPTAEPELASQPAPHP